MRFVRGQTIRYWVGKPEEPLGYAIRDLADDFRRVLDARLHCVEQSDDADLVLVNLKLTSWPGTNIKDGQWERYEITVAGQQVIIAGSDTRGLLFGIYQFSQHALGVDPLYFWIPEDPQSREFVDASSAVTISPEPTFKYRGWFVNDEDLLEEWHYGTYREAVDWYGVRHKAISYEAYERLFETMLRLRVNLIIPATVMDIYQPEDAEVFTRISRRGLMFSQHHIEPVGVCPSHAFRNYCRRKVIEDRFSWVSNSPVVEACWREYINRIAEYGDSVVWQLGYRGAGDVPFWRTEASARRDTAGRAEVISQAITRQYELIRERVGSRTDIASTSTLWWEGNILYKQGLLQLPAETIVVIADVARDQMLPEPLPTIEPGRRYGIYYHTSYWSTGPHLIQGNPPANVFANYKAALDAGTSEYSMQNVSNFRPFIPMIQGVAEFTFNSDSLDENAFMGKFCANHFGNRQVEQSYGEYFKAFVHRQEPELQSRNARWLDGAVRIIIGHGLLALNACGGPNSEAFAWFMGHCSFRLQILKDNSATIDDLTDQENPDNWLCANWNDWYAYAVPMLKGSLNRWQNLIKEIEKLRSNLRQGRALYDSNLYWQSFVGCGLTLAAVEFLEAVRCRINEDCDMAAKHFDQAAAQLDSIISRGPNLAEQDHFEGWTAVDRYMNLSLLRDQLREFRCTTVPRKPRHCTG